MSANTLDLLMRVRRSGARPADGAVTIWYGDGWRADRWNWVELGGRHADVEIGAHALVDTLDLRCLVGLSVYLHAPTWTDALGRLVDRIKGVRPVSLLVCLNDAMEATGPDPERFGAFAWLPSCGYLTFGEWIDKGCGHAVSEV